MPTEKGPDLYKRVVVDLPVDPMWVTQFRVLLSKRISYQSIW